MPEVYEENLTSLKHQIGASSKPKVNFIVNATKWQPNVKMLKIGIDLKY